MSAPTAANPAVKFRLSTTHVVVIAFLGLAALAAVLYAIKGENFFSTSNLSDLLTRSSVLGFVAVGQTLVILGKSLDLSVGYVMALTSLVAGTVMESSGVAAGIVVSLLVAAGIGLINGLVITVLKVNPFIATVGMGLLLRGYIDVTFLAQEGRAPEGFVQNLGFQRIGPLPVATLLMLATAVLAGVLLVRSRFGAHLFAVGGSDDVARLSGIRTHRVLILAHVLCAVAAAIAGILVLSRQGIGSAQLRDQGYDLNSVAAVVLGGTLLMGGRGSIGGTVAGVMIIALLDSSFNVLGVNPYLKDVVRGAIIILAVAVYARRQIDPLSRRSRFDAQGRRRSGADIIDHPVPSKPLSPTTGPGAV